MSARSAPKARMDYLRNSNEGGNLFKQGSSPGVPLLSVLRSHAYTPKEMLEAYEACLSLQKSVHNTLVTFERLVLKDFKNLDFSLRNPDGDLTDKMGSFIQGEAGYEFGQRHPELHALLVGYYAERTAKPETPLERENRLLKEKVALLMGQTGPLAIGDGAAESTTSSTKRKNDDRDETVTPSDSVSQASALVVKRKKKLNDYCDCGHASLHKSKKFKECLHRPENKSESEPSVAKAE